MRSVHRLYAVLRASLTAIFVYKLKFEFAYAASSCPQESTIQPCKCSERLNEVQVWCSYGDLNTIANALKVISQSVPKEIDELILENNNLPSLPGQMFSSIKVLRLMLRDNGLQRVSANWLAGLESNLQELYIVESELRTFPDESIVTLPKLEALTLSAGSITKMPAIFGLSRLRYIQIEASSLSDVFPHNFQGLPFLEQLHITSAPRIRQLNEEFIHDLPKLTILNFTQCGISYVHPRAFTRLPALMEISFTSNKFTDARAVGMAIRDFPNLNTVRLNKNEINRLEEASFVDMPALRNLYLNDNKIANVYRAAFHRLPRLRSLDLSNNQIRAIHPESFLPMRENSIEELWLNNNQIEHSLTIRILLDSLPNLRLLDMSHNFMEDVSYGIAHNHLHLEMLILENNKLQKIGKESFMAMPSLRELKLANNSLTYQLGTPYWNLPALKGLDLSGNSFEHIDRFLLNGLPSLRRFDISRNLIKSVDPATFANNPYLEHVNMSKNYINLLSPLTFSQLQKLFDLDVSNNNLSQILSGIPRNIEYLYIAGNNIMIIPTSATHEFQLSVLKLLDLSANKLHKIPTSSFSSLCTLRTLLLNDNSLQMIDASTFESLPQLRILNLANNRLIIVHKDSFKKLKHLTELNLRKNRLEILETTLLAQNSELRKLDISGNRLTEIASDSLTSNKKIEDFDLSENSLSEFPAAVSGMPLLQILDISRNQMKTLPANILPTLPALKELYLTGNKLHTLTHGIFEKLQNLSVLDLENNELEKIGTHALHNLPNLVMVKMARNKISTITSSAFADLPVLQSVELHENQLTNIANDAFTICPSMLMLNLSNNLLNSLENSGFHGLMTLEALDLSHNKIKHLSDSSVKNMNFLVLLKLDNNRLCNIEGTPFEKMSRLRMLSLRDNKMTSLSETTFSKLRSSILYFDIEGNPVKCSCNMLWLQSWLQQDEDRQPGPRCSDGILLREQRISQINCDNLMETVPGCEARPSTSMTSTTSASISTSMTPKPNLSVASGKVQTQPMTKPNNYLKPLPEETDYFDPKFIEYHENNSKSSPNNTVPPSVMSHFIAGDTPTLYADQKYKNNLNKTNTHPNQGSTAFTFFGMPIPSLNLNNFWNSGKSIEKSKKDGRREQWPPSEPEIEKDGFVPLLPGTGGFVPMNATPETNHLKRNSTTSTHHVSGHASISKVTLPRPHSATNEIDDFLSDNESPFRAHRNVSHTISPLEISTIDPKVTQLPNVSNNRTVTENNRKYFTTEQSTTTFISEPVFSVNEQVDSDFSDRMFENKIKEKPGRLNETFSSNEQSSDGNIILPSPLSEFLVPNGQLPNEQIVSSSKPTIAKVELISGLSPHAEDIGLKTSHLRLAKSSLHSSSTTTSTENTIKVNKNDNMSWYFANYNHSNIEPFVGRLPVKLSTSDQNRLSLPLFLISGLSFMFIS